MPPEQKDDSRWRYWDARARFERGETEQVEERLWNFWVNGAREAEAHQPRGGGGMGEGRCIGAARDRVFLAGTLEGLSRAMQREPKRRDQQ